MGRAVSLPAHVAECLEQALGESVRHVRIFEHSLFARLHIRAIATTRPRRIYLRGSGAEFFANPWLMLHEYWHVLKQWEPGDLTTTRYLLECLRRGYWNNRFEIAARGFADAHLPRVVAVLQGPGASAEQRLAMVEATRDENEHGTESERHTDG
jgi:Domain of unknown function (DUF4157)